MDLVIVERLPGEAWPAGVESALEPNVPVWQTCRREIAFLDETASLPAGAATGEGAYAHLLDVICGLGSPIAGETEVMHQFRAFAGALPAGRADLRSCAQRLLADAGDVRAAHLTGLGSRSYGSAVRRHVRSCRHVGIIGTGMLAREVVEYAVDGQRVVDVWGRRDRLPFSAPAARYRRLGAIASEVRGENARAGLVVAAPVTASIVASVASAYGHLSCLVDLRAEASDDPAPSHLADRHVELSQVFAELSAATNRCDRRVAAARVEIRERARQFALSERPRPSGWHDLCA
jgi:glutamyl-tRNA reductase